MTAALPATGVATGVGSLPGVDAREAARVVAGELTAMPHLAELPARGPWSDMVGRGCALLVDLPAELSVGRWQLTDRRGKDLARAVSLIAEDLDAHEEALQLYRGTCKLQICGPLTLAATIETRNGERALADPGAIRDLTTSLAEGLAAHIRELRRRVPGVDTVVVQLDEPAATGVLEGSIPTASGYRRLPAIAPPQAQQLVRQLTESIRATGAFPMVHSCADDPLIDFLAELDVWALSFPVSQPQGDRLGGFFDAGGVWFAGVEVSDVAGSLASVRQVMSDAGVGVERFSDHLVLTPPCGLAGGGSTAAAASTYANLVNTARRWLDDPEAR